MKTNMMILVAAVALAFGSGCAVDACEDETCEEEGWEEADFEEVEEADTQASSPKEIACSAKPGVPGSYGCCMNGICPAP